ncbi:MULTISPECIES: TM2 domain-containing protein [Clostridium]|uniref:TM2 domain-containing protein n=1 Tax=Clostridium senegalense TaxID=1465809 RepID=A0A6M0H5H7_9CLOT|nr:MULTISPECIES: TM2 domain-containing protein [Clostridium]NEU05986.1 TM2 domain-containing protein [Clostridium senegalense]
MDITARELKVLNEKDLSIFCDNTKKERKKVFLFYILWAIGKKFGIHNFYLNRPKVAIAQLSITIVNLILENILKHNNIAVERMVDMAMSNQITIENLKNCFFGFFNLNSILGLIVLAWVTVDLFLAKNIIDNINEDSENSIYNSLNKE